MKRNKVITKLLYWLFSICLVGTVLLFLFQISVEFLTIDGKFYNKTGYTTIESNQYSGYSIPVKLNVFLHSKKTYNHEITNEKGERIGIFTFTRSKGQNNEISNEFEQKLLEKTNLNNIKLDSIFANSSDVKESGGRIKIYNNETYNLKTNTSLFIANTNLNLKSDNSFLNTVLLLRNYLVYLFLFFVFYYLATLFKQLSKKFEFNFQIPNKIKAIGVCLMLWQITKLIISLIYLKYFDGAKLILKNSNENILSIYPRLEFDFTIFILGLSLLLLNEIFIKGAILKKENDLTI